MWTSDGIEPDAAPPDGPPFDAAVFEQGGDRAGGVKATVTASAVPAMGKSREDVPAPPVARGAIGDWEDDALWEARSARGQPPAVPVLHLDGFDGPMDLLLDLAERQRIDLGRLSIVVAAVRAKRGSRAGFNLNHDAVRTGRHSTQRQALRNLERVR